MSTKELGATALRLGAAMEMVALEEIELGDRYRKDYGDLSELALSLQEKGQLQNIIVCVNKEDNGNKRYKLLAGGRRFAAMERLEWKEASCLIFPCELDECDRLEIEYEENKARRDFDWKEDCAIKARIQQLRIEKYGVKVGTSKDAQGASLRNTAEAIGVSPATLSQDVSLAKAVEQVPEFFKDVSSKKEALALLKKATANIYRKDMAKKAEERIGAIGKLRDVVDRYIIGDFFEGVKHVPDSTVGFVEIDPPYAIALDKVKKYDHTRYSIKDYNEVSLEDYVEFMFRTLSECYRVMNSNSYGVLWHAKDPWGPILYEMLRKCGFETTPLTGLWVKPSGQCNHPEKYLANACEEFFYFWKGNPVLVRQGHTNIFPFNPRSAAKKYHPTERPIELMQELFAIFCYEGCQAMVPFVGSGVSLLAAESLGIKAFGWELSSIYKDGYILYAKELFGGAEDAKVS